MLSASANNRTMPRIMRIFIMMMLLGFDILPFGAAKVVGLRNSWKFFLLIVSMIGIGLLLSLKSIAL